MNHGGHHFGAVRGVGALLLLSFILCSTGANALEAPEYEVKAAFLYNFVKFVEWPPSAFASPTAPIQICVVGSNPFGGFLAAFTRGKEINGRPLWVRTGIPAEAAGKCQMVFVSASVGDRLGDLVSQWAGRPVLTVGDTPDFANEGGIIGLSMQENHVRFEINMVAARQAKLKLSSQLLKVATQVIGQLEDGQ